MKPPLLTADHSGPAETTTANTENTSYAEKLRTNSLARDLAARNAKKAFIHGVDSKVIGTSAIFNGRKTIFLSKEEDDYMVAPFQYSLIGVLDHKHVWIRLFDPNDYARVWMKQTWYFDGFPMRVLKWSSNFDPIEESPIMPIWIKVFGLRPHWFHRQFLYHVASLIGKPLKLDEATTEIDNPVVARICVEINVLERLPSDIPIQIDGKTKFFKVQYEGIPEYCKICRHRGHSIATCYLNKENQGNQDDNDGDSPIKNFDNDLKQGEDLRVRLDKKRGKKPVIETSGASKDNQGEYIVSQDSQDSSKLVEKPSSDLIVRAILQRPQQESGDIEQSQDNTYLGVHERLHEKELELHENLEKSRKLKPNYQERHNLLSLIDNSKRD
ncbi:hypothetical protein BUALT_Bualt06G0097400 [Buddleja alternifolia]|uniref:DUF4283 domain-containing protein n=1 Tax=Buddleja alternifolia TaxID=168488 RepID=A0AAV6XLV5_9LAMI|nr:hypothetical protein BUALT_Bualt06G0097400 [Buddleja alternifolia]